MDDKALSDLLRQQGDRALVPQSLEERILRDSKRGRFMIAFVSTVGVAVVSVGVVFAAIQPQLESVGPAAPGDESTDEGGRQSGPVRKGGWEPSTTWERIPDAPIAGRDGNVAVWTGAEMLVWGGASEGPGQLVNGAAFDPGAEAWRRLADGPLESTGGRTAVWTGDAMLVWGGEVGDGSHGRPDNGAAYDASTDSWTELPASPAWSLAGHSAIWTGKEMVVWGGVGMESRGAAFDPGSGAWRTIAPAPVDGRFGHSAVWTGTEMVVWGGRGGNPLATGAAYDPESDSWRELPDAPISGRDNHTAIWTGEEMIVWGGWSGKAAVSDGAAYSPLLNTWRELPRAPIVSSLGDNGAAWNGSEMIVEGEDGTLAAYSPKANEWAILPEPPMDRVIAPAVLGADGEVIVWGGLKSSGEVPSNQGAILRVAQ